MKGWTLNWATPASQPWFVFKWPYMNFLLKLSWLMCVVQFYMSFCFPFLCFLMLIFIRLFSFFFSFFFKSVSGGRGKGRENFSLFLKREREHGRAQGEGERASQADSMLSREPDARAQAHNLKILTCSEIRSPSTQLLEPPRCPDFCFLIRNRGKGYW